MTTTRKTSTHVYVSSLPVDRVTVGTLLRFADELRAAGAPASTYVSTPGSGGVLRCSWPELEVSEEVP